MIHGTGNLLTNFSECGEAHIGMSQVIQKNKLDSLLKSAGI